MNILFVNDKPFNPVAGGIERVTDILAKELKRRGHSVFYLCGKIIPDKIYLLDYDYPAKLYQLPEEGFWENDQNLRFYTRLQDELNIDIVINQRGLEGMFNEMLPATKAKVISVIHSVPDCYLKQKIQLLTNSSQPPFAWPKRIIKKTFPFAFKMYWGRIYKTALSKTYEQLSRYSDAVITLSKQDVKIMCRYVSSAYRQKIQYIGNPNSYESTEPSDLGHKQKIVLYVARLDKFEKEPLRMLQIWRILNNKFPEWHLRIVGDGPERNNMEEYAKKHKLTNVCFDGRQKDVQRYYKEASFICLTSNFEGWGMTLTEGMQYGCIPFTFDNYGAASEIIDDNLNDCLIPPFNLRQYAHRMAALMCDELKRKEMSKAAVVKVKKFSAENIVDKWEKLLSEL